MACAWSAKGGTSGDGERTADALNLAMIDPSGTLVPIASTAVGPYGRDRYGHAWQTQIIPSPVPYPTLGTLDRDSEAYQTWWVDMVRARNRVADALEQAARTAVRALAEIG